MWRGYGRQSKKPRQNPRKSSNYGRSWKKRELEKKCRGMQYNKE